ncbi:SDR family NAD(P)-dependent oxidoreductase [Gottfriedia acidiceleris]|uniref:SDR family NAD(P)-dependent oxidoreductase n=1 Tax=Gottfriedia acidiceleris TaxID=371036 RepID=UPI003D1F0897
MKTILVTGGTDGIGKGVAMHYLKKGDRVIVVGSSTVKGEIFNNEAKQLGAEERAIFLQANLSLVQENLRIIQVIKERFNSLDLVVLCATKHNNTYIETQEGFELTFALYYLSRFILSYGLKEYLESSENPVIINVCAPGMKGEVNWEDLQHKKSYKNVSFHGSRLNDLLGVAFAENDPFGKIKYVLYNPWAVQTSGVFDMVENRLMKNLMKLSYKIIGKPVEEGIKPIIKLLENPPKASFAAFKMDKEVSLTMKTFDKELAQKLNKITLQILEELN